MMYFDPNKGTFHEGEIEGECIPIPDISKGTICESLKDHFFLFHSEDRSYIYIVSGNKVWIVHILSFPTIYNERYWPTYRKRLVRFYTGTGAWNGKQEMFFAGPKEMEDEYVRHWAKKAIKWPKETPLSFMGIVQDRTGKLFWRDPKSHLPTKKIVLPKKRDRRVQIGEWKILLESDGQEGRGGQEIWSLAKEHFIIFFAYLEPGQLFSYPVLDKDYPTQGLNDFCTILKRERLTLLERRASRAKEGVKWEHLFRPLLTLHSNFSISTSDLVRRGFYLPTLKKYEEEYQFRRDEWSVRENILNNSRFLELIGDAYFRTILLRALLT